MQYKIIKSLMYSFLESEVEKWIKIGWRPQGGICVIKVNAEKEYYQAMVKEDEN
jgi:hypothetical protein